jgi:hypothetical protein
MDGWRGAGVVLACVVNLFAGCATQAPFRPIADPSATVQGDGFSVRPPGGEHWLLSDSSSGSVIAFGKNDPALFRQGGSVIAVATRERARQGDISTPEGLRAEVDAFVRRHSQSHQGVTVALQPYRDAALDSDCVRKESSSEEHGNRRYPDQVLLMTVAGKACRVPSAPASFVQVTYSSRRPAGVAPILDEALRRECEVLVDSLAFNQAR